MTTVRNILPLSALIVLLAAGGVAGDRTGVQGVGMARSATAMARGIDAVGINPANLGFQEDALLTFGLFPVGIRFGNDVVDYSLYSKYFAGFATDSGRVGVNLSDADKSEILSRFPGGLGHGIVDADFRSFGMTINGGEWGCVALTMTDRVSGRITLPEEYVRFLFYGNPPGSTYDFSESQADAVWAREYALSYGRRLPDGPLVRAWYGGVSVKLVHGLSYLGVERFAARLSTSPTGVLDGSIDVLTRHGGIDPTAEENEFRSLFPAPAGVGLGLDLGLAAEVNDILRVGASVTDIGAISWTRHLTENSERRTLHLDNPMDEAQRDSLDDAMRGESRAGASFRTGLPATLRLGGAVDLHRIPALRQLLNGELTVAVDYVQGLVDAPGTSLIPRGSIGAEYRPWHFLPIRAGIALGGGEGTMVSFGIGFHSASFDFDCATESLGWLLTPNSTGYGSAAIGMRLRI